VVDRDARFNSSPHSFRLPGRGEERRRGWGAETGGSVNWAFTA